MLAAMRSLVALAVVLAPAIVDAKPAALKIGYDAEHLDLANGALQFRPSRDVVYASLEVITDDGKTIATITKQYDTPNENRWLSMTWQPTGTVMMLKLRAGTGDGVISRVELIPWSVTVDHEDVNFASDSSKIAAAEEAKLDASFTKIEDAIAKAEQYMKLKLFVAGHTDTVGASAKNRKLSLARATAIAKYLQRKGLDIPVAVAGYGEDVLLVKTPDSTDEGKNRRADYVLGPAGGGPPFKGPYLKVKVAWKDVPAPK